jgi:hypothetical protein
MGRGQRSLVREVVFTAVAVAGLLALGAVALYFVIAARPEGRDPALDRIALNVGPAPVALDIRTQQDTGGWVAWVTDRPMCTARAATEKSARVHVGLAAQLGMRPECRVEPIGGPGPEGREAPHATALPPEGWYVDPRKELGEFSERWWTGTDWSSAVRPPDIPWDYDSDDIPGLGP